VTAAPPVGRDPGDSFPLYALLFTLSGTAALIYQMCWMRELALLFGNTTEAAATTLAVFFLGLAIGAHASGRQTSRMHVPLRAFAGFEFLAALLAPLLLLILPLFRAAVTQLVPGALDHALVGGLLRLLVTMLCLLPSAACMGAGFPPLVEAMARARGRFGRTVSTLYALNTAGAAVGALLAGFWLPRLLGWQGALLTGVGLGLVVGVVAWRHVPGTPPAPPETEPHPGTPRDWRLLTIAFGSGALALGLEVVWTRLFARVLQNSVYTYATLVVVFLVALAVGAAVAHRLCRLRHEPRRVLRVVLILSALAVVLAPRVFGLWQDAGGGSGKGLDFGAYVRASLFAVTLVLGVPAAVLGIVFPYLARFHTAEAGTRGSGGDWGQLLASNTIGALVGALCTGFVLVPLLGATTVAVLLGAGYLFLVLVLDGTHRIGSLALVVLLLGGVLFEAALQSTAARERLLPRTRDAASGLWRSKEKPLAVRHGRMGTVTVSRTVGGTRRLRLDRDYVLGASSKPQWERLQAYLPMALSKQPERVFFLGMGTGITAGAATSLPFVKRIVVAELVPEVVDLARAHFRPEVRGLFTDNRVQIRATDGRLLLGTSDEVFDVIVADLFVPWRRGVGSLFTQEHLEAAARRLAPHGLYAQWLPLYQMSSEEVACVVRTFATVFPQVTLWRGDFFSRRPILCVVGERSEAPFDFFTPGPLFEQLGRQQHLDFSRLGGALPALLFAGRVERGGAWPPPGPVNTDDHPWLELHAPVSARRRAAGRSSPCTQERYLAVLDAIRADRGAGFERYQSQLMREHQAFLEAGHHLHRSLLLSRKQDREEARAAYERRVPAAARPILSEWTE
jgi:spermidine synthase